MIESKNFYVILIERAALVALSFCMYFINIKIIKNNEKGISKSVLHSDVEGCVSGIGMVLRTIRV